MNVQESTILDENSVPSAHQNEVSDPLKHLLSLDWEQPVDLSKPKNKQNDMFQSKTAKKVRFSDEINQISGDNSDIEVLHVSSPLEEKEKKNDNNSLCEKSKESSQSSPDSKNSILTASDLIKSFSEISIEPKSFDNNVIIEMEESGTEEGDSNSLLHSKNPYYHDNTLVSEIIDPHNLVEQVEHLSITSSGEKEAPVKDLLSKKDSLFSFHGITAPHSINEIPEESVLIKEKRQVSAQNKRTKQKVHVLKQTGKLNSLLKNDSEITKASDLKSSVYEAWSQVKKETKTELPTFSSNKKDPQFVQKPAARCAFLLWKKSAVKTMKSTRRTPNKNKIPSDISQKPVKSDDNESQMAYLSWKKSKDEILKQQTIEKFKIERQQRLIKLKNEEEKRKDSISAFLAWKNHKANIFKFRQLQKSWIMEKKREAAEQKTQRVKEALQMYDLWLDYKHSSSIQRTDATEVKPPWYPPGRS